MGLPSITSTRTQCGVASTTTRSSVWAWTIPLVTSSEVSRVAVSTNSRAPAVVRTSATNRLACRALSGAGGSVTWRCSPLNGTTVVLRGQATPPRAPWRPLHHDVGTHFGAADRDPAHPIGGTAPGNGAL